MAGGGGGGTLWVKILIVGAILTAIAYGLEMSGTHVPQWLLGTLLALGGLGVIFGSCEAMIVSVEGVGDLLSWNAFVAGTMAGLASNIPEIVMLGSGAVLVEAVEVFGVGEAARDRTCQALVTAAVEAQVDDEGPGIAQCLERRVDMSR